MRRFKNTDSRFKKGPRSGRGGFTIVETLVAITILMIAVVGPLTVATQAYHAALDAKNQMIAANLAQETVEEVRNYKDNHITDDTLDDIFVAWPPGSTKYGIEDDPSSGGYYLFVSGSCAQFGANCRLYYSPSTGYSYDSSSGSLTPFQRWFTLTKISGTEFLLTVTVSWTTGAVPDQIVVADLLSNTTR